MVMPWQTIREVHLKEQSLHALVIDGAKGLMRKQRTMSKTCRHSCQA